ncbi:MAG: hypothetical protein LH618_00615 [Saprospiraceae bacterium]|nr:hypothetical protein [Saprospiraceae bacterium]
MRLLFFLATLPAFLIAQSAFLKDPDIVWAVEIEQDWVVDVPSLEVEGDSGITTLKLLRTEQNELFAPTFHLADFVIQAALQGKLPIFKDAQCQLPADISADVLIPLQDTIITFDPEMYEEKIQIVLSLYPFRDFRAWRLRQILAYHKKSATWSTSVEAIAPLIQLKNGQADSTALRPLFWFRPDNKRRKLTSNDIVWAKKTRNVQNKTQIPTQPLPLVKLSYGFQNPLVHLLNVLKTDQKIPFYDAWNEKPLSSIERTSLLAKTDTVMDYANYQGYEEIIKIVHREINATDFSQLRLLQTWYWDDRRNRLSICLDAVAPVLDVMDNEGNFRFRKPLFYRRTRR